MLDRLGFTLRVAFRNLSRNRWRSALTAGGIAVAVGAVIWTGHMFDAMFSEMVRGVTAAELGDVQIHSKAYLEERNLYNGFDVDRAKLDDVRAVPGVDAAAGRVIAFGLIGHEDHSSVAKLIGVDAVAEQEVTRTPSRVSNGRWLSDKPDEAADAREVVVGRILAQELGVEVGQELVVILQAADGGLGNDRLKVVGTVATGNSSLDRMGVYMHLADVQWLTALEGRLHEVAIRIDRGEDADRVASAVQSALGDQSSFEENALVVRSWTKVVPQLHQITEMSRSSSSVIYFVIYLIVGFGIFNTQRMTALERRREFGVLLALGTLPGRLIRTIVTESAMLAFFGGLVGVVFGGALVFYHATSGFSFTAAGEPDLEYMGVTLSDKMFFQVEPMLFVTPLIIIAGVGVLCGLWPAFRASRLNIPLAISGRQ